MTIKQVRDNFILNLAENAYLNMCTTEEMNIVISALEKQIPKFVKCPKGFQGIRDTRFYCPACNALTRQREDFCHKCGQAVKYPKEVIDREQHKIYLNWSDTE